MLLRISLMLAFLFGSVAWMGAVPALAQQAYDSHPPMRPLPVASNRPMGKGPAFYVDPIKGDDAAAGGKSTPWQHIELSLRELRPGDTLYLREGTYYERFKIQHAFDSERPITIRSYPNELAIIDAGIREFYEDPEGSWEPAPGGHPDEYRSTQTYQLSNESRRSGNFGDSMVPLFRYRRFEDLRSNNEVWSQSLRHFDDDADGIYAGPGILYDVETGHIHVRLSHTKVAALGKDNYRGETDPREVPLIISSGQRGVSASQGGVLIQNSKHIRLQDVVIRGANRVTLAINESQDIEVDGVTIYGGWFALDMGPKHLLNNIRISNCAIRGYSAPWHSRAHQKYRSGGADLVQVRGTDISFAGCEMTDHHDGLNIVLLEDGEIAGNLFDNFTDDGIRVGGLRKSGIRRFHGNFVSRCYQLLTTHSGSVLPYVEPGSGTYVYRNVFDARRFSYRRPPNRDELDLGDEYLDGVTAPRIIADHKTKVWARYYVYQNTFVHRSKVPNRPYGFRWSVGTADTQRRVHNNIFLQVNDLVCLNPPDPSHDFKASNNLFWSLRERAPEEGGFQGDVLADPLLIAFSPDPNAVTDFGLRPQSPAINAGLKLPANWPDELRDEDAGAPDIGALPYGVRWKMPGLVGAR